MWITNGVYAAIGATLFVLADFPIKPALEHWRFQLAATAAFVVANAAMTVFKIDRNNALRRSNETLTEIVLVVGLFWLTPWAVVTGRVVAAFTAWYFTKMRWQWRAFNGSVYLIVTVILAKLTLLIDPDGPLDGGRAVAVAALVWVVTDTVNIIMVFIVHSVRYDKLQLDVPRMTMKNSHIRLIAAAFGLIVAIALDTNQWMLLAVGAVGTLFVIVAKVNSRASSLDAGIVQISRFSAASSKAEKPEDVEHELIESVLPLGRLESVAIASARDTDTASSSRAADQLVWTGTRRDDLGDAIASRSALAHLVQNGPQITSDAKRCIAGWSIDHRRHSALIVETADASDDPTDLWSTVGHLVDHARLAIDTVYKSRELTELARLEYERGRRDPLTLLPNRAAAIEEIAERLAQPDRSAFSLVLVETLQYQESVNILGQDFGNASVSTFAERLKSLANVDYIAHVAASRFALLVLADADGATRVAEQACASRRTQTTTALPSPNTTVTMLNPSDSAQPDGAAEAFAHRIAVAGIVVNRGEWTVEDHTTAAEELIRAAGIALDDAANGKKIAVFGPSDAERAERRMSIRFALDAAIETRDIYPVFQPQVDLATGAVLGCEVLARWDDAKLGKVLPDEFIPVSEQNGQIDRLTIALAEQALDAARWWGDDAESIAMSINVAAQSLDRPDFVKTLHRLVDEVGRPTSSVTIEITESTLIARSSTIDALNRLRGIGFRISIDDFGTGYSALSYLDRLPVDEVKIDQTMVLPISPENPVGPVMVHLVELCESLGHSVVAEGIEDHYQRNVLRSLGCHVGQGYLFSRPLSSEGMTTWLANHRIFRSRHRATPTSRHADTSEDYLAG